MSSNTQKKAITKARAAGRPSEETVVGQDRILLAAIDLLRQRSPDALKVVEVATEAGVDPALVRYYFGNKKGLLKAVALKILDEVQAQSQFVLDEPGDLKARIRRRLKSLIAALRMHPRFLQLVLNEVYHSDGMPADTKNLESIGHRGVLLTEMVLQPRSETERLHPVDARLLHVAILGICTFFVEADPLVTLLFGADKGAKSMDDVYLDFAAGLLERGLKEA